MSIGRFLNGSRNTARRIGPALHGEARGGYLLPGTAGDSQTCTPGGSTGRPLQSRGTPGGEPPAAAYRVAVGGHASPLRHLTLRDLLRSRERWQSIKRESYKNRRLTQFTMPWIPDRGWVNNGQRSILIGRLRATITRHVGSGRYHFLTIKMKSSSAYVSSSLRIDAIDHELSMRYGGWRAALDVIADCSTPCDHCQVREDGSVEQSYLRLVEEMGGTIEQDELEQLRATDERLQKEHPRWYRR